MTLHKEQIDHINLVNWFHHEFPELADDFHHFANERVCSAQQGRTLKRMGVKKGVADFFLAFPMTYRSGLWIELKVGKNELTTEQSYFLHRKSERGYASICVYGFEQGKEAILNYLTEYKAIRKVDDLKNLYNSKTNC